eukprot:Unigene4718_Nuclearia_a/m.14418 Unigene4718_Nuclearia_a/g.14418  ORF Unigene4718_Nuclearia_a/g.14418 Unigene4718_Nuclearia_a/m.14418 type:complete len:518 (+) Unigene4718_Nuclearia_a:2181-3734(+)
MPVVRVLRYMMPPTGSCAAPSSPYATPGAFSSSLRTLHARLVLPMPPLPTMSTVRDRGDASACHTSFCWSTRSLNVSFESFMRWPTTATPDVVLAAAVAISSLVFCTALLTSSAWRASWSCSCCVDASTYSLTALRSSSLDAGSSVMTKTRSSSPRAKRSCTGTSTRVLRNTGKTRSRSLHSMRRARILSSLVQLTEAKNSGDIATTAALQPYSASAIWSSQSRPASGASRVSALQRGACCTRTGLDLLGVDPDVLAERALAQEARERPDRLLVAHGVRDEEQHGRVGRALARRRHLAAMLERAADKRLGKLAQLVVVRARAEVDALDRVAAEGEAEGHGHGQVALEAEKEEEHARLLLAQTRDVLDIAQARRVAVEALREHTHERVRRVQMRLGRRRRQRPPHTARERRVALEVIREALRKRLVTARVHHVHRERQRRELLGRRRQRQRARPRRLLRCCCSLLFRRVVRRRLAARARARRSTGRAPGHPHAREQPRQRPAHPVRAQTPGVSERASV